MLFFCGKRWVINKGLFSELAESGALAENIKASLRQRPCQPIRKEELTRKNKTKHIRETKTQNIRWYNIIQWHPLSGQCKPNVKKLYKFTKHHLSYRSDQYLSRARLFNHKKKNIYPPPEKGEYRCRSSSHIHRYLFFCITRCSDLAANTSRFKLFKRNQKTQKKRRRWSTESRRGRERKQLLTFLSFWRLGKKKVTATESDFSTI